MSKNDLVRKIRLVSISMMSQPAYQTIVIHMLTNISRRKGNQAMIFGQLIEHNMGNIFFWGKSCTKYDGDTIPRPFSKKTKLNISLDQYSKDLYSLFFMVCQVEDFQNISKLSYRPLVFTSYKSFFFKKKVNN